MGVASIALFLGHETLWGGSQVFSPAKQVLLCRLWLGKLLGTRSPACLTQFAGAADSGVPLQRRQGWGFAVAQPHGASCEVRGVAAITQSLFYILIFL